MKKSVLSLAVAGALALPFAAQADTILYGSARVSIDYLQIEGDSSAWDVVNNDSRLGVLGSEDLGGGLSAVYQYEFGVDVTEGTSGFEGDRPKFVGLRGNFGTVTVGTQDTPYYNVAGIVDIFNSANTFGSDAWLGGGFDEDDQVGRGFALTRLSNSLYYASPDFNGFSGEVMLVMDSEFTRAGGFSDGIDIWNIALKYEQGPFFAGLTYIALNGNDLDVGGGVTADLDLDQWALGLGYTEGPFNIGFIYEQGSLNLYGLLNKFKVDGVTVLGGDDAKNFYLAGSYTFGNNIISAAYGRLDPGTKGSDEIDNFIVGYQYNFSRRTSLWAEYIGRSSDDLGDLNAVSIGTRVDF